MLYQSSTAHKYAYLWSQYRPTILKLMNDCLDRPQHHKLSYDELTSIDNEEENHLPFVLRVFQGDAINNIKTSPIAKDLLLILKRSQTANMLTDQFIFEFKLDEDFVLHIKSEDPEMA